MSLASGTMAVTTPVAGAGRSDVTGMPLATQAINRHRALDLGIASMSTNNTAQELSEAGIIDCS